MKKDKKETREETGILMKGVCMRVGGGGCARTRALTCALAGL